MAYGLDDRLFIENGPSIIAAGARARRSTDAFRAWRGLAPEHRLAAVEGALGRAANDDHPLPQAL